MVGGHDFRVKGEIHGECLIPEEIRFVLGNAVQRSHIVAGLQSLAA